MEREQKYGERKSRKKRAETGEEGSPRFSLSFPCYIFARARLSERLEKAMSTDKLVILHTDTGWLVSQRNESVCIAAFGESFLSLVSGSKNVFCIRTY